MKFEKFKRMRFNLRFPDPRGSEDFVTIHSVKELQDCLLHRTIAFDDLIDYFRNGQLHRWLECLDADEAERASNIKKLFEDRQGESVANFAASLLKALGLEVDEEGVEAFVLDYVTNPVRMLHNKMSARNDFDSYKKRAVDVINGFKEDKSRLLEKKEDLKFLRKYIAGMLKRYGGLLMLEEFHFIEFLKNECPLGALALLTLKEGQKYKDKFPEVFKKFVSVDDNGDTLKLNKCCVEEDSYLLTGDSAPVKIMRRVTKDHQNKDHEWESLVGKERHVLVLWASLYTVNNCGDTDDAKKYEDADLNGKFQLFWGLDACSRAEQRSAFEKRLLAYIEVPNDDE